MRVDDNLQNSVWFWPYVINVRFWKPGLKPGIIDDTHFVDGLDVREASGVLCLVLVVVILIVRWWNPDTVLVPQVLVCELVGLLVVRRFRCFRPAQTR